MKPFIETKSLYLFERRTIVFKIVNRVDGFSVSLFWYYCVLSMFYFQNTTESIVPIALVLRSMHANSFLLVIFNYHISIFKSTRSGLWCPVVVIIHKFLQMFGILHFEIGCLKKNQWFLRSYFKNLSWIILTVDGGKSKKNFFQFIISNLKGITNFVTVLKESLPLDMVDSYYLCVDIEYSNISAKKTYFGHLIPSIEYRVMEDVQKTTLIIHLVWIY